MGNSARETERGRERMEAAEGERGGADLLRMGNSNSASESAMGRERRGRFLNSTAEDLLSYAGPFCLAATPF